MTPLPEAPYQVFTRDVVIGGLDRAILARPREPIRRQEVAAARRALERASIPFVESVGGFLEGGDVVVQGSEVFVGVGDRTERGAATWLGEWCAGRYELHVLEMKPGFLHLDMVFNVLGPDRAVCVPEALRGDSAGLVRKRFSECLELDLPAQRSQSTNFLPIGERAAIGSTTVAGAVRDAVAASGRELHLVELGEIQKAGGSVRCATCLV